VTQDSGGHDRPAPGGRGEPFPDDQRAAVYRVIEERRDVRRGFLPDPIPADVLERVLAAAHRAPSVGFSQPWDFIIITDRDRRQRIKDLAEQSRAGFAASLPAGRARSFDRLKTEAIMQTPVNVVVTCDPTRGGRHTLGRHAQPQTAMYSSVLAVANFWLAARAEGLGVGWVSFFSERELAAELRLPPHLEIAAYLCVGYVAEFGPEPELALAGWARRRPLGWAVHSEEYGRRELPGREAVSLLDEVRAGIRPLDPQAMEAARQRQALMTKPAGSLGQLEDISIQLAGLAGACPPSMPEPAAVAVFAADHGVHAQAVTPWPQEVTAQMVANFLDGGAVVNAFAAQAGAEVVVVDVGVNASLGQMPGLLPRKIGMGTSDFTAGPAMTPGDAIAAIGVGIEVARDLVIAGNRCLLTGDMGIANTTASAALIAAFTGQDPAAVTGLGTGVDSATLARKVDVVRAGLALHRPNPADPVGVLAAFGGFEHAALAGFIVAAAALRVPVILDGVIAGAAALAACAIAPLAAGCLIAGHRSVEPGAAIALEHLGLRPLIDLDLRLGEGTGALLALPIVQSACRALREVATFDSAGVTEKA
jgi:nicotinate-nucleotide--dimethylbenzimidazole phosphoribosyltransferase